MKTIKMEIKERLKKEMIFKPSDTDVSARLMNYWCKEGIIDDNRPNGKGWRYFTITEVVWIEIVLELRRFGFDLPKIKKVKKLLLPTFRLETILNKHIHKIEIVILCNGIGMVAVRNRMQLAKETGIINESYLSIDLDSIIKKVKNNIKND